MKNTIKIVLFLTLTMLVLLCMPIVSNAASTETATDEESLITAIENVDDGGTVEIQNNITVTKPIVIQKTLTIDGNGYTVAGSTEWTSTSGNQTMFTAQLAAGKLTLKDINLNNGPKYGVQAYDGATVILNNVSIVGFRYGGVLVNGGNVEVIDLHLGFNGADTNNGIEIDKGASATNNPTLTMNGTLTSDVNENVVRPATNGHLTEFTVTNTENTINKVVIAGDKVVLTDKNNNVISENAIPESATPNTDVQKVVVTLIRGENSNKITVDKGATVTAELLKSHIKVPEGYEIDGFFTDENYTNAFDFNAKLDTDTTIYARTTKIENEKPVEPEKPEVNEEEKDDVPKTGVESYLGLAILTIIASTAGIVYMKRREEK